jgi:Protein of unknown function (DUF998)
MANLMTTPAAGMASPDSGKTGTSTRRLLTAGLVAGPLYLLVGSAEALTRPGFDPTRDDWSLLSSGDLGWIHIALFISTGLLTIAGAAGMRRALAGGRGSTWGPRLVGLYGLGLIGAGIFIADPARGFPPGTPADAQAISWHGLLHLVSGGVGFAGLIAACMVFARRFAGLGQRTWAAYSVATGVLFFAAFVGIASGSQSGGPVLVGVTLAFTAAVVLGWAWISALAAKLMVRSQS